jgi:hypothetical protein
MSKFSATGKQQQAFNDVIAAIKKAKKSGLVFYGKQNALVVYTKSANNYISESDFEKLLGTGYNEIPYLSSDILEDSGADDYACFLSKLDEETFS